MVETVSEDLRNIGTITLLPSTFNPCDPSPPSSRPPRGLPDWPEICVAARKLGIGTMETPRKLARQAQVDASRVAWPADEALPVGLGQRLTAMGVRRTLPPKLGYLLRKFRRLPVTTNVGGWLVLQVSAAAAVCVMFPVTMLEMR
jgi:hypothetical protein